MSRPTDGDRTFPIIGEIAAGGPIEAYQEATDSVTIPDVINTAADTYVLRVRGDSMVDAHILDGDLVVIRQQQTARDGDIVVALAGQDEAADEATVKRFFREKGRVRLQPENSTMDPLYPEHVSILGRVVGVFRRVD